MRHAQVALCGVTWSKFDGAGSFIRHFQEQCTDMRDDDRVGQQVKAFYAPASSVPASYYMADSCWLGVKDWLVGA